MSSHPEFVVIPSTIIFNEHNQVLLGKRSMHKTFPGKWGIPGGKVESVDMGEHILETTLMREAMEEMGIVIEVTQYLKSDARMTEKGLQMFVIFASRLVGGEAKPLEDTDEVKWWDVGDILEDEITPGIYRCILQAHALL